MRTSSMAALAAGTLIAGLAAAAPAEARGGTPVLTAPVTANMVCTGTSHITVTLQSASRRTNEIVWYTTDLRAGYWYTEVTRDADGGLVHGFGAGWNEVAGGAFLRQTTSLTGTLPRGTSQVTVVSERTDSILGMGSPVLETCTAHLTVTTR